jgi:Ca2+/H+ antiporter, TMEM165/GDT1 family
MNLYVAAVTFPVVFIGELPDKTMFANLLMATRGRPLMVWLGASAAFAVHVVIAVTVGVALFKLVPHRALDIAVALLFLAGAAYAWVEGGRADEGERDLVEKESRGHSAVLSAFVVIFLAEWGDLTQVLTAELAARYRSALAVGVGAFVALLCVAALAVTLGQALSRLVSTGLVRRVTGVVLLVLAGFSLYAGLA